MTRPSTLLLLCSSALLFPACGGGGGGGNDAPPEAEPAAPLAKTPSESGTVQLRADGAIAYVINETATPGFELGKGSLTAIEVRREGADASNVLGEIAVGRNPQSLSVSDDGTRIYVSNGADNSVTVIDAGPEGRGPFSKLSDIAVGSEPRGTALSPSGDALFVANYSDGSLSVIDTTTLAVSKTVPLTLDGTSIQQPFALACSDDGDPERSDAGESLYVTDFFGRAIPGKGRDEVEGFDDGKEGRAMVLSLDTLEPSALIRLSPIADSGFTADRSKFEPVENPANTTFESVATDPTKDVQGCFFNQLYAISIDPESGKAYLPTISAAPEPPVKFNVNVQAVIGVIDLEKNAEIADKHTNLNSLIKSETQPTGVFDEFSANRLDRAFAADTVAMATRNGVALFVSRAGSFVMRGSVGTDGSIGLDGVEGKDANVRIPTGNIPTGVAISPDGSRAYVYGELSANLTAIDLTTNLVIKNIDAATTPTDAETRRTLLGKLAFYTGMGLPADVSEDTDPKSIDTLRHRNMASDNNWSSCASCHPNGLTDGVTWMFPTGPRQTIPLDGSFAPGSTIASNLATTDQRVFNFNAVRGSVTDFNNNARGVQGGHGFTPGALATIDAGGENTDVPDAGLVTNHGSRLGVSNALDFMTEWVARGIRVFNRPTEIDAARALAGRNIFAANCASCHGGAKWTSSTRDLSDLVAWPDPLFVGGVIQSDRVLNPAATAIIAFDKNGIAGDGPGGDDFEVRIVQGADTLDLTNPIEVRGAGGLIGKAPPGAAASFNPPSIFGVANSAPYGHHGRAQTLHEVFEPRANNGLGHATFGLTSEQIDDVVEFLKTVDGNEPVVE